MTAPTLFQEDWWYEAATAGRWQRVEVRRDGVMLASLPVFHRRRHGLRFLAMPPYTRTVEPYIDPGPGKEVSRLSRRVSLLGELLEALPPHDRFELALTPGSEHVLGFVAQGCMVSSNFTFAFDAPGDLDALWAGMDQKTRNLVRSYAKRHAVEHHQDLARFIRLSEVERGAGGTNNHDFAAIARIVEACRTRGRMEVLSCLGDHGEDVAAAVLVWGGGRLYYWLSARDPERSKGGANSLLLWEAIRTAHAKGLTFDSDGFDALSSIRFLGNFGLRPVARPVVNRANRRWRIAFLAKTALSPGRRDLTYRG